MPSLPLWYELLVSMATVRDLLTCDHLSLSRTEWTCEQVRRCHGYSPAAKQRLLPGNQSNTGSQGFDESDSYKTIIIIVLWYRLLI